MLPGPKTSGNRLDLGQRWAYLAGAVQWYGDLLALAFFVFLLFGAANVALGGGVLFRKLTGFLVAAIPLMMALGLIRAIALVRRGTGATWRDAFGAFMIWQSTSLVVARASVQGLFASEAEFLRTPKTGEVPTWSDALKGNRGETLLGLLGIAGIVGGLTHHATYAGPLTAGLLLWPTIAFAAAPWNSLAARRAVLPPKLRARRRTEALRSQGRRRLTGAAGGLALAGGAAAGILALLAPGSAAVVGPQLLRPAQGHHVQYDASQRHTVPSTDDTSTSTTTIKPTLTTVAPLATSPPTSTTTSAATPTSVAKSPLPPSTAPPATAAATPPP
jgi:hypothetical protein